MAGAGAATMAKAEATLREFLMPKSGISTKKSASDKHSPEIPYSSFPSTSVQTDGNKNSLRGVAASLVSRAIIGRGRSFSALLFYDF